MDAQALLVPTMEELQNEQIGYIHYIKPMAGYRNIRNSPNGTDIGDLFTHEAINFYPDSNKENWVYIQKRESLLSGWVLVDNKDLIFVKQYTGEIQLPNYMKLIISGYNLNVETDRPELL